MHAKKNAESRNFSEAIDELEVEDGPWTKHLRRREQDILDMIIHGREHGHYFMLLGAKVRPDLLSACQRWKTGLVL